MDDDADDAIRAAEHAYDHAEEWREFYHCKSIPKAAFRQAYAATGERRRTSHGSPEPLDEFMDRLFSQLRRDFPELFPPAPMIDDTYSSLRLQRQPLGFFGTVWAVAIGAVLAQVLVLAIIFGAGVYLGLIDARKRGERQEQQLRRLEAIRDELQRQAGQP